jgi:uncharacterized protein
MFELLKPHICMKSVLEITPDWLREWGIEALLLDVDCTLKRYPRNEVEPEIDRWLKEMQEHNIRCCIVSNGLEERIRFFAEKLHLPYVSRALKPFPSGVKSALGAIAASPSKTAIVGDQLFADILAGRLAGIRTILVEPIHPEEEPWYTRLKRTPEAWALKWLGKRS